MAIFLRIFSHIWIRSESDEGLEGMQGNTREDHTRNFEAEEDNYLEEQDDDGEQEPEDGEDLADREEE